MCHHPDMGRHARGAVRSRVVARAVGIAAPAVLIVVAGWSWVLGSAGPAAVTDSTVSGSAVVVSSLACRNGDEGTVVDVQNPAGQPPGTTRRATLDACGHHPGEIVAVEYSTADPGRVVLSAVAGDAGDSTGRLLPLGLILAALLGVAAAAAVVRDARRPHPVDRRGGPPAAADGTGRGRHARPDDDEPVAAPASPPEAEPVPGELDRLFPARESLRDNLHDELFTHRSAAGV